MIILFLFVLKGLTVNQFGIHLYHIAYSQETLQSAPAEFLILDNLKNERPDWFEYWPIRNFLNSSVLNENDFYGFFSPKFSLKTGLNAASVRQFVASDGGISDCYIISPQPDMGAFYLNVFEQGEAFDNGTMATIQAAANEAGLNLLIEGLVMDSRRIVFSNYFLARPTFWRAWLNFNEIIFSHAENENTELGNLLREPTSYNDVQRKVFIQERTASLLLATNPHWKCVRYNPFKLAWSGTPLNQFPLEAVISDALKIAYTETRDQEYLSAYTSVRANLQKR
ncbi:MAG: hypothetical protein ORN52_11140 [Beijerinckiaceae bacterium]|nr:hypothetical protein [Beijerinckiaceae bacterium]